MTDRRDEVENPSSDKRPVWPNGEEAPRGDPPPIADVEMLDEEELELRNLRIDIPGSGSTGAGLTSISVVKTPPKEQFFRTHPRHVLEIHLVESSQGLDVAHLAIAPNMVEPMISIRFRPNPYRLYLTITRDGVLRFVPVRLPGDGDWNSWHESKQAVLLQAMKLWVRIASGDGSYEAFPLEHGKFPEPVWPDLSLARLIRLAFRDKGRLVDNTEHPYFQKLLGRVAD